MERFQNGAIVSVSADGDLGRPESHTRHAITPAQVHITYTWGKEKLSITSIFILRVGL